MSKYAAPEQDFVTALGRQIDAAISSAAMRAGENMAKLGPMALVLGGDKLKKSYLHAISHGEELKRALGEIFTVAGLTGQDDLVMAARENSTSPIAAASASAPASGGEADTGRRKDVAIYSLFLKNQSAKAYQGDDGVVIMRGSVVNEVDKTNFRCPAHMQKRDEVIEASERAENGKLVLTREVIVSNFSAAATVLVGKQRNARCWRDENGQPPVQYLGLAYHTMGIVTKWIKRENPYHWRPHGQRGFETDSARYYVLSSIQSEPCAEASFTTDENYREWLLTPGFESRLLLEFGKGLIEVDARLVLTSPGEVVISVISSTETSATVHLGGGRMKTFDIVHVKPRKG